MMKDNTILLALALLFYVGFDTTSTLAAFNYLGTFQYESSFILKAAFDAGGVIGFVLVKCVFSTLALLLAYLLSEHFEKFRGVGNGILLGAGLSGFYVGMSNMNIVMNDSSFWLMSIDSGTIAAVLLIGGAVFGFMFLGGRLAPNRGRKECMTTVNGEEALKH